MNKYDKEQLEPKGPKPVKKLGRSYNVELVATPFIEPKNINPTIDRLIKEVQSRGLSLNKTIFVKK